MTPSGRPRRGAVLWLATARLRRDRKSSLAKLRQMLFLGVITMVLVALNIELVVGPSRYLDQVDADFWLVQPGTDSTATDSFVAEEALDDVRDLEGVRSVTGVFFFFTKVRTGDASENVVVVGHEPGSITQPQRVVDGRAVARDGEAVVDAELDIPVGATIGVAADEFEVVGTAAGVNAIGKELVFVTQDDMADLTGSPRFSALAVDADPGALAVDDLAAATGLQAFTGTGFSRSNTAYWSSFVTPLFVLVLVFTVIGATSSLVNFLKREVEAQSRNMAVLKTMGMRWRGLASIELLQLALLGLTAFGLSIPLAVGLLEIANLAVPGVTASLVAPALLAGAAVLVYACLRAPIGPILLIRRTDPSLLYKS